MAKAELHTVRTSAKETGYTGKYIRDLLYEDRIPGARKAGGRWIIPAAAVEELKRKKQGVLTDPELGAPEGITV
jgi:hypothetical protein